MNDTPADVQPEKNMNDPIEAEIDDEFWNDPYLPLVIVVSFCCCWPIGLVLIGLHPKISRKTKVIVFGCCAVLFAIIMIIGAIGAAVENAKFDEANALWYDDKQEEAVAIYEDLVDGESGGILADSKLAIVYGRLIDHEASKGNTARATMWMERAEKFDVVPKTQSKEAQVLISESRQKAAEEKAQQAEPQAEEPQEKERKEDADKAVGEKPFFESEDDLPRMRFKTRDEIMAMFGKPDYVYPSGLLLDGTRYHESWSYKKVFKNEYSGQWQELKIFFMYGSADGREKGPVLGYDIQ